MPCLLMQVSLSTDCRKILVEKIRLDGNVHYVSVLVSFDCWKLWPVALRFPSVMRKQ